MNVFIDTNIFLSFYRASKRTLEELSKISEQSKTGNIRLFISDYLKNEFYRNREKVIAKSIHAFARFKPDQGISGIFAACPEVRKFCRLTKDMRSAKNSLLASVRKGIQDSPLLADSVIDGIFNSTETHVVTEAVLKLGVDRTTHGNPPGHKSRCGDAVHWEWLLSIIPNEEDLILISNDKHFRTELNTEALSSILSEEWKSKKNSSCMLYGTLSAFFGKHFPQIKIAEEISGESVYTSQTIDAIQDNISWIKKEYRPFAMDDDKAAIFRILQARVLRDGLRSGVHISLLSDDCIKLILVIISGKTEMPKRIQKMIASYADQFGYKIAAPLSSGMI